MTANEYGIYFFNEESIMKLIMPMDANLCEYRKKHRVMPCKLVNCMVCELYINKSL